MKLFGHSKVTHSKHILAILLLILCALSAVFLYLVGAFDYETDALASNKIVDATHLRQGSSVSHVQQTDKGIETICIINSVSSQPICGATLWTSETTGEGWNLNEYTDIEIGITKHTEHAKQKVKLSLKNYNEIYSTPDDVISQKYNSVEMYLNKASNIYTVPLSYFQVESWWMSRYNVEFDTAQVEYDNVQAIEILLKNVNETGIYRITIDSVKLKGQLLGVTHILTILLVILILIIFLLIDRQRANQRKMALIDPLTKLHNRRGLYEWVSALGIHAKQSRVLTVLYMDIDDFKHTNDTYGHLVGDLLLKGFCERVSSAISQHEQADKALIFTRLSGDEFIIIVADADAEYARVLGESILNALVEPLILNDNKININVSMGIASLQHSSSNIKELMRKADAAMYFAKKQGKNQFKIYDSEVEREHFNRQKIADDIAKAIDEDAFELAFVPIFNTHSKQVHSVEVLLKAKSDALSTLDPSLYLSVAKEFALLEALDTWLFESTLKVLNEHSELITKLDIAFCINVSLSELINGKYLKKLQGLIEKHDIAPHWLMLEISAGPDETKATDLTDVGFLHDINNAKIALTLDRFGEESLPIEQLSSFPIRNVKLSRKLLDACKDKDSRQRIVVQSIIKLAKNLDISVIAESVDSLEQFYLLESLGCDMIQGNLFCEALSLEELAKGLRNQKAMSPSSISTTSQE
ncbi:putative bifunctional diguanylate cyclase/phosphodiesterase [Glaciecola siphonariae]|uniref:Bifunctional diguanylate cyclase/phosphodiesterase n=1 Tax=Glaciecola siphonariae TaxID=521012 RepID=A0ABV9LX67_9ALTE